MEDGETSLNPGMVVREKLINLRLIEKVQIGRRTLKKFMRYLEYLIDLIKGLDGNLVTGARSNFEKDWWVGDGTLKDKFPRLYEVSDTKDFLVCDLTLRIGNGPHKSTFGRYRGGGNCLIGKKTWKNNFWKSSTLLCPLCNKDAESIQHIMLSCEVAQRLGSSVISG